MAAGCRGPPAPGRGGLQAIDVAEARRQARLHDVGQQVLKNDVDGYKHRGALGNYATPTTSAVPLERKPME